MDQRRRRIVPGDILHRHEREELFRFLARVPAGDCFRPKTGLAAEVVEDAAIALSLPSIGHGRTADLLPGFIGADLSLVVPRMRARSRIPIANQISVAKVGQESARSGMDP